MKILVIPDIQAKPGMDFTYLSNIGKYICEKRPDVVVCIGDLADMPSLSSYDVGKRNFEGRRYTKDVEATIAAQTALFAPLGTLNKQQRRNGKKIYIPRTIMTIGNHEARISRAINDDPKLEGLISIDDLQYKQYFDEVYDFLEVVVVEGVAFSHYFTSGTMGRPVTSAAALLSKKHMSAVMGHVQQRQIAYANTADGRQLTGIFAGVCNEHDEDYLGAQGNSYWRGIWVLHEVDHGSFDEMPVSLKYINERYK